MEASPEDRARRRASHTPYSSCRGVSAGPDLSVKTVRTVQRLAAVCNRRTGAGLRGYELEDVTQDVLVATIEKAPRGLDSGAFEAWIYGACRIAVLRRIQGRAADRRIPWSAVDSDRLSTGDDPQEQDEREWLGVEVKALVEDCGTTVALIIRRRFEMNEGFETISGHLNRSFSGVRSRYYRALRRLRRRLEPPT